ncbi:MAG: glycosyltransferase family 1 protein, partial [Anaerolineales bacterium]
DAALLVDPYDVDAIAAGLARLVSDTALRADLTRRGVARAARFRWGDSARQLIKLYERLAI